MDQWFTSKAEIGTTQTGHVFITQDGKTIGLSSKLVKALAEKAGFIHTSVF